MIYTIHQKIILRIRAYNLHQEIPTTTNKASYVCAYSFS